MTLKASQMHRVGKECCWILCFWFVYTAGYDVEMKFISGRICHMKAIQIIMWTMISKHDLQKTISTPMPYSHQFHGNTWKQKQTAKIIIMNLKNHLYTPWPLRSTSKPITTQIGCLDRRYIHQVRCQTTSKSVRKQQKLSFPEKRWCNVFLFG